MLPTLPRTLIAALLVLFALAAAGGSAATTTARNGRIAWKGFLQTGTDGASAIYVATANGTHRRQLTHPGKGVDDDLPDWSPDGSTILFERLYQPHASPPTIPDEVMRVDADGTHLTQIGTCTAPCVGNDDPQYSHDGRRIVFTRPMYARDGKSITLGVWVMGSDGSDVHQITQLSGGTSSEDHEPAWSPNGRRIVFTRLNDSAAPAGEQALFVVASSGGAAHRITRWSLNAGGANWSPDGARILFQSYRDCPCSQPSQAFTVTPGGSHLRQLTHAGTNIEPNWSPDGRQIIYAHRPGAATPGPADIWKMAANGTHQVALIRTKRWESEPDWGPAAP